MTTVANAAGDIDVTGAIPPAVAGTYTIEAAGETSQYMVTGTYTVQNVVICQTVKPYTGATLNFLGTIPMLSGKSAITVTYGPTAGIRAGTFLMPAQQGEFTFNYGAPWTLSGAVQFQFTEWTTATKQTNVETATVSLKLYAPSIALNPNADKAGKRVVVAGSGFAPSEQVAIYLDQVSAADLLNTGTATSAGDLATYFYVPESTVVSHTIVAAGVNTYKSGVDAKAPFQIIQ